MAKRKGMGKGKGKGYKNIIGKDPKVHSDSAKGRKQPQRVHFIKEPFGLPFEMQQKNRFYNPKNTKLQNDMIDVLDTFMNDYDFELDKMLGADWVKRHGNSKSFEDVQIYTDKEMTSITNDNPDRGWTGVMSGMEKKKKGSNVVLCVTYDGAGGDILEDPNTQDRIQQKLDKKFGKEKYFLEPYTNWAFQIYKNW